MRRRPVVVATVILFSAGAGLGQSFDRPFLSFYGTPGLVDMPTAEMQPDGQFSATFAARQDHTRTTLTFQLAPRITASFRYAFTDDLLGTSAGPNYDRSFSIAYQAVKEGPRWPALTVGIQDAFGTGQFEGEYIVATKTIGERWTLTGGLGWGRLGSRGSFTETGERDFENVYGGKPAVDDWFRGPVAPFGGVRYKINDKWSVLAEYSSDAYDLEERFDVFEAKSPINFGVNYRANSGLDFSAYSLYGTTVGVLATLSLDPKRPPYPDGREAAPRPVAVRGQQSRSILASWGLDRAPQAGERPDVVEARLTRALDQEGLGLERFRIEGRTAHVTLRNGRYDAGAQAIGRASRAMAATLPPEVETFRIAPVAAGMPISEVTVRRSDLERLENDPDRVWKSWSRTDVEGAGPVLSFGNTVAGAYPEAGVRIQPYIAPLLFDPDDPFRWDAGVQLGFDVAPAPGFVFSGLVRGKVAGNRDEVEGVSDSLLPHVRTDLSLYDRQGPSYLSHLTAEYFFRPGRDLYGRATAGYLERMYGGVSAEVLWNPVQGPLALGAEINYAVKRDFDGGFGFQDYDVVTGHASLYYQLTEEYYAQVDAGRYLAGDWGGTLTLSRNFANGWRAGGFVTLTDVSAEDFGEGSFDKGLFLQIPLSWLSGEPTQDAFFTTIRPVQRDGGQRLDVRNRLYDVTEGYQDPALEERWGQFWR